MKFYELPKLPFNPSDLQSFLSVETFEVHHKSHHQAYIDQLNRLLGEQSGSEPNLINIIKTQHGPLFNQAGQAWNHTFYWYSLSAQSSPEHASSLQQQIQHDFGSWDHLKQAFMQASTNLFGSGWTWLVIDTDQNKLKVVSTANGDNPIRSDYVPLINCDIWEHAYYIDYRNKRKDYLEKFWQNINWDFAEQMFREKDIKFVERVMKEH